MINGMIQCKSKENVRFFAIYPILIVGRETNVDDFAVAVNCARLVLWGKVPVYYTLSIKKLATWSKINIVYLEIIGLKLLKGDRLV